MRDDKRKRRPRKPLVGRHPLTLGALALLGVSGYELWIRLEDFWAWSAGIRRLSTVQGTSFIRNMSIIFEAPEMRQLGFKLLFLALSIIFALICLLRRSRARGAWIIMLLDLALAGTGLWLGIYGWKPQDWATTLKLVPLGLILAGCVMNYSHRSVLKRRKRKRMEEEMGPRDEARAERRDSDRSAKR